VNRASTLGYTPLHLATVKGFNPLVSQLLEADAAVGLQNDQGLTALHYAASSGNVHILQQLIEAGASINIQDKSGNYLEHTQHLPCIIKFIKF
jgi:ankyrin repeat protein